LTVPPVANLNEIEVVAREITAKRIDDLTALRHIDQGSFTHMTRKT
jgi:hypothetical protein